MDKVNILILGDENNQNIIKAIENLNLTLDLNLNLKDCSKLAINQNIENFFSLINDTQYFNALFLNFSKKEEIINFFKSFNSDEYGITNECYPFLIINEKTLTKSEARNFIIELNKTKENEYKFKIQNLLFFNDVNGKEFQYIIIDIYNCYFQDSKKLKDEDDSKETINIVLVGVKNSGKSFLINKLLGEIRALSMENNYTTKMNAYKHKKYPIIFYDISGFNENEDEETKNLNSKIEEFNKEYKNIKNKIHAIFYVIDCNSVRILQNKEKELIENIFKMNIPIFIVGQKAKITNTKNFIRKTKFELTTFAENYKEKIEVLTNRIYCLDSSKDSYINLLKAVYNEFLLSKKINEEIIGTYSMMDNEELLNNSFSEKFNIKENNEERQKILEIYSHIKKSIFFNNFIETIKEVHQNVTLIKERYLNEKYYFKNLNIEELSREIENEFRRIFSQEDLEKIYKLIKEQENDLNEKEKGNINMKYYYAGSAAVIGITIPLTIIFSPFCGVTFPILCIIDAALIKKKNDKTKSLINESVDNFYSKFEWKYILINLNIITKKAEIYNQIIDEFNKFIIDFTNNDLID